jgi:hypothetical protein
VQLRSHSSSSEYGHAHGAYVHMLTRAQELLTAATASVALKTAALHEALEESSAAVARQKVVAASVAAASVAAAASASAASVAAAAADASVAADSGASVAAASVADSVAASVAAASVADSVAASVADAVAAPAPPAVFVVKYDVFVPGDGEARLVGEEPIPISFEDAKEPVFFYVAYTGVASYSLAGTEDWESVETGKIVNLGGSRRLLFIMAS